jgi:hypothetical protein
MPPKLGLAVHTDKFGNLLNFEFLNLLNFEFLNLLVMKKPWSVFESGILIWIQLKKPILSPNQDPD